MLRDVAGLQFGDMVKAVVDVEAGHYGDWR